MLLSKLIAYAQEQLDRHGDAEVTEMRESGGELQYFQVVGINIDDFDGDDNEAPTRCFVIASEY